jgi:hypothetical protein
LKIYFFLLVSVDSLKKRKMGEAEAVGSQGPLLSMHQSTFHSAIHQNSLFQPLRKKIFDICLSIASLLEVEELRIL